ncbi:MAG TPA: tripartite tricarboxylate transporter substrate binding protein [Beijerinckiaceae bacterium]|nr:tripartite tricarboxylate transporter substrate binding protein [Beijerinckiaceae bacterium]
MSTHLNRRSWLAAAGAALALPQMASAQGFPNRVVRIVVPYPPGGPTDALARIIANEIQGDLGQTVIVENKPGGAGSIGTRGVARGETDGHTIVLGNNQTHVNNAFLVKEAGYDPIKDFAPLAGLADLQHVLVVTNALAATKVSELVALAKKDPGKFNYGSTGIGSGSHLAMELFKTRTGTDMTHIPYQGAGPMAAEVMAGRIELAFATLPSVLGQIRGGSMRALAVASLNRAPQLPDVPTLKEQGLVDSEADSWLALFSPAATPPEARDRLTKAVLGALGKPAVAEGVVKLGFALSLREPAAFATYHKAEMLKWEAVIKAAKVEPQ